MLIATLIGVALGHFVPEAGVAVKPLGDGFIELVRMMIAPISFCTVVAGDHRVRFGVVDSINTISFVRD